MDDLRETPPEFQESQEPPPEPGQDGADGCGTSPAAPGDDVRREPLAAAKETRDRETRSFTTVEFTSERVSAGHLEVAGQIFKQNFNLTTAVGGGESIPLSPRHFMSRTAEELERCEKELIFEPSEIEELRSSAEETRFLILTGEPERGKGSLGLLLGSRLTQAFDGDGMLTCQGVGASVQIDLEKVADDEAFHHKVVMFEDSLAGENADLRAFLKTVDPLRLTTLKERLRKSSTAILLTATSSSLVDFERRLENLGILRAVAPPSTDLLVEALRRFAARLPPQETEAVAAFLADHEADLACELTTIPRISRFVHDYLPEVASGGLSLRQALSRMDDLSQWLTADLADDLDAQGAVLALVLGSAVPPSAGMPYFTFDDLRRRIIEVLRKELRIPEDRPSSPRGLGRAFLDRARAHVVTLPSLPNAVRFRDDRYPRRLWQALVGPARELATLVIPLLRELVLDESSSLRETAAAALGRLGQIGPADLAAPLLHQWMGQASTRDELLGAFLEGSAGSDDPTYRDFCLATLRDLVFQGKAEVSEAAVCSLSSLSQPDPAVPIRELCGIAQKLLPIQLDLLREVAEEMTAQEEEIRRETHPRQVVPALQALHQQDHLLLVAALVPEERIRLLGAVQYALAGVLFAQGGDPGPVLRELIAQIKAEPVQLAPLFAYLFLHPQGLIDLLDRYKWSASAFGMETSRFLLASRPGEQDPEALRELLERIFSTLDTFPGFFRSLLERRFLEILKSWSREGCEVAGLRPVVVRLLSSLRDSKSVALRRRMERFLETDPDFVVRGSRLRALARDVLDGKGLDAVPEASPRPRRLPAWLGKRTGEDA